MRQALIHLLDRQALADTLQFGLTTPADTVVSPSDPVYRLVEQRGLAKYPYDVARGERLLADAGWTRGADGTRRSPTGEPFTIDIQGNDMVNDLPEDQAIASYWNTAGIETTITLVGLTAPNINELRHTFKGVEGSPQRDNHEALQTYISSQIGTAANGWNAESEVDRQLAVSAF